MDPSAPAHRGPIDDFLQKHQTGLADAVGTVRDLLVRFPYALRVVGAAIDVGMAVREHRRGHDVKAMVFAFNAGRNVEGAVRAARASGAAADDTGDPGDALGWRGRMGRLPGAAGEVVDSGGPALN